MAEALLKNNQPAASTLQDVFLEKDGLRSTPDLNKEEDDVLPPDLQRHDTNKNHKIKTNSLKRMLRIKRGAEDAVVFKDKVELVGVRPIIDAESSHIDLTATSSRLTLKSSLSNYWNSMFKQKKNKSQKANDAEIDSNDQNSNEEIDVETLQNINKNLEIDETLKDELPSAVENILKEEIQALKISEEN